MSDSNSKGPMWCAPHIEGQYLRDEIAKIVTEACKGGYDWFHGVYALLEKHELPSDHRTQFYAHATSVEDRLRSAR